MPSVLKKADAPKEPLYRLRLKTGVEAASFQSGGKGIDLDSEHQLFETTVLSEYLGARDLPFLEEVSE